MNELSLKIGAGKGDLSNIEVKEDCRIEVGAGKLNVNQAAVSTLSLKCGAGDITWIGSTATDTKVDCGIGNIEMTLMEEKESYKIKSKCGVGKVVINNETISQGGASKITLPYDSAVAIYDMDIKCGVGSIYLNFEN